MASHTQDSEQLWFLNSLVAIRIAHNIGQDGMSLIEQWAPHGDSPPLHFHRTEDELFYVLEGELRIRVQQEERWLRAGQTVLAPKGIAHTYRVESSEGAHWLVITTHGDFERFVRALSRPAEQPTLPPLSGAPTPEAIQHLTEIARAHGIEIVGPPLQ
ncbi:MAG TPA: cupin domain-containing protein [Vicinamibacterales bacterium]|nr:cupin domain-containing protein [Vicinamibacterales bacterium]